MISRVYPKIWITQCLGYDCHKKTIANQKNIIENHKYHRILGFLTNLLHSKTIQYDTNQMIDINIHNGNTRQKFVRWLSFNNATTPNHASVGFPINESHNNKNNHNGISDAANE